MYQDIGMLPDGGVNKMIGTKFFKENFDGKNYADAAKWCNANGATIEDKGDFYEVVAIPAPSLDEIKQAKVDSLKSTRDTLEVEPITYNGNIYDYDDKARERMRIAQQALSDNNIPNQLWTTYDNTQVELTVQDFKNINTLAAKRSGELHIHYNTLKQEVLACTTNEDVEKIEW